MAATKLALVAVIAGALLALAPPIAAAATYTVDNKDGGGAKGGCGAAAGDCNLAAAINQSNSTSGVDMIDFDSSLQGEIDLSADLPTVRDGVSIVGPGARVLTIDGQNSYRPLRLGADNGRQVRISGLTFRRSYSAGVGGAINVEDTPLRLNGVRIEDSESSGAGGAIYAIGSEVEISDSVLADSEGKRFGGAIYLGLNSPLTLLGSGILRSVSTERGGAIAAIGDSPVTIERSTLADNWTTADEADGGAVYADSSDVEIRESTLSGNLVAGRESSGGAVYSTGTAKVSVYSSALTGNKAPDYDFSGAGGAIAAVEGGPLTVEGSSFSGNEGGIGGGGAILTGVDLDVENSTFFGNTSVYGGAIYSNRGQLDAESITVTANDNASAAVEVNGAGGAIRNSILAGNERGDPVFLGSDLIGDTSEALVLAHTQLGSPGNSYVDAGNNIIDPDPKLGPLADNGGLTETMAISTESPAYNAGSSAEQADQRGVSRPQNGRDDIGAYELDTKLEGFAKAKKKQMQKGKRIVVKVKVKAGEDLEAEAAGRVKVKGKSYGLKPTAKRIGEGTRKNLTLKPKKRKDAKRIAKALRRGKKAGAKLRVRLTDAAGNGNTAKLSARLKR